MHARDIEALLAGRALAPAAHPSCAGRTPMPRMRLLAVLLAGGGALLASSAALADGGDTQETATCIASFVDVGGGVLGFDDSGTTAGKTDNYDLPPDTTAPTLEGTCATIATGAGPAGSLPRGAVYTGTGTGPDAVYRMDFPAGNPDTLTITMTPSGFDGALITYCNTVSSNLSDGLAVDDTGLSGNAESVTVGGIAPGTSLYIVVDGYSTGATPPGPSGAYTLSVRSNGTTQPAPCGAPSADLAITKTDGTTTATPGDTTTYTITATNAGPSDVTDATVTDTFPAACTAVEYTAVGTGAAAGFTASGTGNINDTALTLPAGESITYTAICTIDPSATGSLENTATIASATADPDTNNNSATDTDTLVPTADVTITKDDGVASIAAGESTTWSIVASNLGPSDVLGAQVEDLFPAACETVAYTATQTGGATGFTAAGNGNIVDTVDLPAGSSITYTATCDTFSSATGDLENTATIVSPLPDPVEDNAATDVTALEIVADIYITKDDGVTTAVPGGSTTYTITVGNTGPSDVGAQVEDLFPAACTSVAWTAVESGGATGFTPAGTGNIADFVDFPAGSSVVYTATCEIDPAATGTLENTASAGFKGNDPDTNNNQATDIDTLGASADLSITKDDGVTSVTPGESTTYTIVASNAGPSAVLGASVADTFPAACASVAWTAVGAGGAAGFTAAGTGNIADTVDLPAGAAVTYTATCDIDEAATGTLENTATIASTTDDPDTANNTATDTNNIGASADLSITKTDGVASVEAGESTTYTIVVSNAGPSAADPVAVTDTFPAACTSVAWTAVGAGGAAGFTASGSGNIADAAVNLPSGASVTYTATCEVDAEATDGDVISNTATVAGPDGLDPVTGNNSATDNTTISVVPEPALVSGTKSVSGTFEQGGAVSYTIVLSNTGTGEQADNAGDEFVDVLPAGLALVSASASSGAAVADIGTNTVRWNGAIAASASVTITIDATIAEDATGSIANQGAISYDSDGDGSNDTAASTDDPSTGDTGDATAFEVVAGGVEPPQALQPTVVPTFTQWGSALLLSLLGALGLGALWRRGGR